MKLTKATIREIKTLLEIEKTASGLKVYSGYFTEEEIKKWIEKEVVFLIENNKEIVGSISYERKDKENAEISGLVIKPEFQKQGLAFKAMTLLLEELKNYKQLSLVVHPDNHAVRLYESLGFAMREQKENYFGDGQPRLIMIKNQII